MGIRPGTPGQHFRIPWHVGLEIAPSHHTQLSDTGRFPGADHASPCRLPNVPFECADRRGATPKRRILEAIAPGIRFGIRRAERLHLQGGVGPGGERGCEQVPNFKPEVRVSYLRSGPRSAGQSRDGYLLTCREFEYGNDTWVHLYYQIDDVGKRVRLRADSAGRPWLGVVAREGEIWGAFLKPDSISLLLTPLDPAGADRAVTVGLWKKFTPREMLKFHHGRNELWMEYDSFFVNVPRLAASPGPSSWRGGYDHVYEFPQVETDSYGKWIRIEISGPIPREVVYDFSEYMK